MGLPRFHGQWSSPVSVDSPFWESRRLYDDASEPVGGTEHSFFGHTHWERFNQANGRATFRRDVNGILARANPPARLDEDGHIRLIEPEGYEALVDAPLPPGAPDQVAERVAAAVKEYRDGRSADDLRHAVRDLGDALEMLRDDAKKVLPFRKDEADLFQVLNTYGIRHLRDDQRTDYDSPPYHRWLFYVLLATVHLVLRLREDAQAG